MAGAPAAVIPDCPGCPARLEATISLTYPSTSTSPVAEFGTHATRDIVRCRVCGRTLLLGERSLGFFTHNGEGPYDVCELCVPRADRYGLRAQPSTPEQISASRRHPRLSWRPGRRRKEEAAALAATPLGTAAVPVALAAFNTSSHARTLAGLYKTLGSPRASVIPRSPTDREVILTVAWEIVWYQFRITPDGITQQRGTYLSDLALRWQEWNCDINADGTAAPPQPSRHSELPLLEHATSDQLKGHL